MPVVRENRAVAVFGSSEPSPGTAAYRQAQEVGRLLGAAGFALINGGYAGVMEASARGAREAGGRTIGVTMQSFTGRSGANAFIDREFCENDLFDRTRRLIEQAAAFIVLPGRAGTLAELAFLWALRKTGHLDSRPIVLVGAEWEQFLQELARLRLVGEPELSSTLVVQEAPQAVAEVLRLLAAAPC